MLIIEHFSLNFMTIQLLHEIRIIKFIDKQVIDLISNLFEIVIMETIVSTFNYRQIPANNLISQSQNIKINILKRENKATV